MSSAFPPVPWTPPPILCFRPPPSAQSPSAYLLTPLLYTLTPQHHLHPSSQSWLAPFTCTQLLYTWRPIFHINGTLGPRNQQRTQATHIYPLSLSRCRPFLSQTTRYSFHGVLGNIIYLYSYRCHTFLLGGQDVLLYHTSGVCLRFLKRTFPPIRISYVYIGPKGQLEFSSFVKESWRSWYILPGVCLMVKYQYSLLHTKTIYKVRAVWKLVWQH